MQKSSFRKGATQALSAVALALFASSAISAGYVAPPPGNGQAKAPVLPLPSGVTIQNIVIGTGAQPTAADTVRVHYTGKLENGIVFDSSVKRGTPASFPLTGVIPCWSHALKLMTVGSKAILTCPANTAYGDRGVGGIIPPGAKLTFEIELLAIQGR